MRCFRWREGGKSVLLQRRFKPWAKIRVFAMPACTGAFGYLSGRSYTYMFYMWACYAPLGLIPLLDGLD